MRDCEKVGQCDCDIEARLTGERSSAVENCKEIRISSLFMSAVNIPKLPSVQVAKETLLYKAVNIEVLQA